MPLRPDEFLGRFEPLRRFRRSGPFIRYGIAVVGVGAAILTRLSLESLVTSDIPFVTSTLR
jgi:hypothetical protein